MKKKNPHLLTITLTAPGLGCVYVRRVLSEVDFFLNARACAWDVCLIQPDYKK